MKKFRGIIVALVCAFIGLIFMTRTMNAEQLTAVDVHGQLSVTGTNIVDKDGKPFQLRGISTHGINWDVGYPYVNQDAFRELRDQWGVNAVRLAMYTVEYNGYTTVDDNGKQNLKNIVNNGVEYAKNLGMYAIIDWHILSDGNPQTNKEEAKKFFNEISAKYKDYNNVLYEICNEPNGCSWEDIKSYANEIIPIIRANDPDAIIIVGTPTWSQLGMEGHTNEVADNPLTGYSNIVYSLHFYCAEWAHTQYLPAKVDYAVSKGLPILVSEFGVSAANGSDAVNTTQGQAWLEKLDNYNIGYFCWSLSNKNETSALIANWCSKTSGWSDNELSDAGKFIKSEYLKRKENFGQSATYPTETPTESSNAQVRAFVERLYSKVLGRNGDSSGIETWTNALVNHTSNGVHAGYGFVFGIECMSRNLTNEDFLEMLYNTFMNRASDAAGKAAWMTYLNAGVEREKVFEGFIQSAEFNGICNTYGIEVGNCNDIDALYEVINHYRNQNVNITSFVSRCYTKALGRNYDSSGIEAWCEGIIKGSFTPKDTARHFIISEEFEGKNLNNEEYLKVLYRTFMGREADASGMSAWMNYLNNGTMTREQVLDAFADSKEFAGIIESFNLQ